MQALASRAKSVSWIDSNRIQCECPICAAEHGGTDQVRNLFAKRTGEQVSLVCFAGHADKAILQALELTRADLTRPLHQNGTVEAPKSPAEPLSSIEAPAALPVTFEEWKYQTGMVIKRALWDDIPEKDRALVASMTRDKLVDVLVTQAHEIIDVREAPWWPLPAELTDTDVDDELHELANRAITVFQDEYLPKVLRETPSPARELVVFENADQALISNDEYLKRKAIVDRLDYERAISLIVGGKHEGKTTLIRTEGLAVSAGEPVYGRATIQVPVVYAASDDEYATTRMELLRMGWQRRRLPLILVRINSHENPEPEQVLEQLARFAEREGSRFVILDMLFDFIRVVDENKYAQTRAAVGHIQTLAEEINGHVTASHHTPKWMPDAASAAKAALGSQGIVAKFSPILLAKKWADNLFTLESTMTRDPRGEPIKPVCMVRDENGWAQPAGEFKQWMKWVMYRDRILGLFEGQDERRLSVRDVSEALEVSKHEVANALLQMTKDVEGEPGPLDRIRGRGTAYLYFLRVANLFESSRTPKDE